MLYSTTLLALLASGVGAFDGTFAGGPVDDYTEDEYAAFFAPEKRNATGVVHFDAYNVSESFPPNNTISGWEARIEVAPVDSDGGDQTFPGTRITFQAPEDVVLPGNDSDWNSCIAFLPPDWLKKSVRGKRGDEGASCSFLSDDCQTALQAAANGNYWDGERCSAPAVPQACEKHMGDGGSEVFGLGCKSFPCPFSHRNKAHNIDKSATNFSATFDGSTAISHRPRITASEGMTQEEAYKLAVGGYWTIMINWGRRDPQSSQTDEEPQGSVICLKADRIENDSEGAAIRLLGETTVVLFTALFTSAWLIS